MQIIPLAAIPNQSFTVRLDGNVYDFTIKIVTNVMCCTIVRNGTTLVSNIRVVGGTLILPYRYLEKGNFLLDTNEDDYPIYTEFGVTQQLFYFTQEELDIARAGT